MSVKRIATRLVPTSLRPFLRSLLTHISRSHFPREHVPHTRFPLEPAMRDAIAESLRINRSSAVTKSMASECCGFPDLEKLTVYWGIVRGVTQLLEPYNSPLDKYFHWSNFQERMAQGLLDTSKDLFAIWAAIHKRPKVILEIGCRTGKSIALQLFVHPDPRECTVLLIDPFIEMGSPKKVALNLERLFIPKSNDYFFVGYSESVLPHIMNTFPEVLFDYVLVDGSHRKQDALRDLQMVTPFVSRGGYIVLDDIGSYGPDIGYGLIDVWNTWKAEAKEEFYFREYEVPWDFAAAQRK